VRGGRQVPDPPDHLPRQRDGEERRQDDHGQRDDGERLFLLLDEALLQGVGDDPGRDHPQVADGPAVMRQRPQRQAARERRRTEDRVPGLVEEDDPAEEPSGGIVRRPPASLVHPPHPHPPPPEAGPLLRGPPGGAGAGSFPVPFRAGGAQQEAQAHRVVLQGAP